MNRYPQHRWLFLLFVITAASLLEARTFDTVQKRTFEAVPGQKLDVHLGNGDIFVEQGAQDAISFEIRMAIRSSNEEDAEEAFEKVEVNYLESEESLSLKVKANTKRSWWWFGRSKAPTINVYVTVPENCNLVLKTGSGNISAKNVVGYHLFESGSGDFEAENLGNFVNMRTSSGNIDVTGFTGDLELVTGSGDIDILNLIGNFDGSSGSGNISIEGSVPQFNASSGSGDIQISSSSDNFLESSAQTGSGNIDIALPILANVQFSGNSNSGNVHTSFPSATHSEASEKAAKLTINQGGPAITAKTQSGDITLSPNSAL